MLTKKEAGNPCGALSLGSYDAALGKWVTTAKEVKFGKENEWKLVSLTREEYFGRRAYASAVQEAVREKVEEMRALVRKLSALSQKIGRYEKLAPKKAPKGMRGRRASKQDDD
jgi:hypothetical protein